MLLVLFWIYWFDFCVGILLCDLLNDYCLCSRVWYVVVIVWCRVVMVDWFTYEMLVVMLFRLLSCATTSFVVCLLFGFKVLVEFCSFEGFRLLGLYLGVLWVDWLAWLVICYLVKFCLLFGLCLFMLFRVALIVLMWYKDIYAFILLLYGDGTELFVCVDLCLFADCCFNCALLFAGLVVFTDYLSVELPVGLTGC